MAKKRKYSPQYIKNKASYDKVYSEKNREYIAARSKVYRDKNKEALLRKKAEYYQNKIKDEKNWLKTFRATSLRVRFGITEDQYRKMLFDQGGVCKICGKVRLASNQNRMGVDHDHRTETLRGILCNWCNAALGHFDDSIELLQKAIDYIKLNGADINIGERIDTTQYANSTRNMRYIRELKIKKDESINISQASFIPLERVV